MPSPQFLRFPAAVAGACASLAFAASATATGAADHTIAINPGNVPAVAADYEHECAGNLGGGPIPGKDVWVFNLPGNANKTGVFTSISAAFDTNDDGQPDTTVVIDPGAADGDDIVFVGHSKAYAITAAGWTLVGATATITGEADKFVLTHTCPATPSTSPSATPSSTPSTTPSATPSVTPSTTPSTSPSATPSATPSTAEVTPSPSASTGGGTGEEGGGLALTGANAGGAALLGLGLVGGGALLLVLLRRRRRFIA
jgi:hypothetical protein